MKKLLVSVAIIGCLSALPACQPHAADIMPMMQSSPQAEMQPYEIQYLDTMVKHHEDGIKMFEMAGDEPSSPTVKVMAEKMVADQEKEIPELKALREKISPEAPAAINMKLMMIGKEDMSKMDMSGLEKVSGMEFDRKFLEMTIMHHQCAVDMSDVALKKSKNIDFKKQVQMIHDKQKEEIVSMKKLLAEMKKA